MTEHLEYYKLYQECKKKYDNVVMLYRAGTFYHINEYDFDEDVSVKKNFQKSWGVARQISKMLDLQMKTKEETTKRPGYHTVGIPHMSLNKYLPILFRQGNMPNAVVVLVEQNGTKKFDKNTKIERMIDKIYTKSTLPLDFFNDTNNEEKYIMFLGLTDDYVTFSLFNVFYNNLYIDYILIQNDDFSPLKKQLLKIASNFSISQIYYVDYRKIKILKIKNLLNFYKFDNFNELFFENLPFEYLNNLNYCKESLNKLYKLNRNFQNVSLVQSINFKQQIDQDKFLLKAITISLQFIHLLLENCLNSLNIPQIISNVFEQQNKTFKYLLFSYQQLDVSNLVNYINNTKSIIGKRELIKRLKNPFVEQDDINQSLQISQYFEKISIDQLKLYIKNVQKLYDFEKIHRKLEMYTIDIDDIKKLFNSYLIIDQLFELINKEQSQFKQLLQYDESINIMHQQIKLAILQKCNIYQLDKSDELFFQYQNFQQNSSFIREIENTNKVKQQLQDEIFQYIQSIKLSDVNDYLKFDKKDFTFNITPQRLNMNKKLKDLFVKENLQKITPKSPKFKNEKLNFYENQIKKLENDLNNFNKRLINIFIDDILKIENVQTHFLKLKDLVSSIDIAINNVENKRKKNYNCPVIQTKFLDMDQDCQCEFEYECSCKIQEIKSSVDITALRHPIIEKIKDDEQYISNDVSLSNQGILLYGENAAGKSSLLKSIGLAIIMSQAGLYGAYDQLILSPFQQLLTQVDFVDNIYVGKSSFLTELDGIKEICKIKSSKLSQQTLILIDELTKGTEHPSSIRILGAILSIFVKRNMSFLITTHNHDIVELKEIQKMIQLDKIKIKHLEVNYDNNEFVFNRKLKDGKCSVGYGVLIAKKYLNDPEFDMYIEIIDKDQKNDELFLSTKKSNYNTKKFVDMCEKCSSKINLHTHHLFHQKEADENGFINNFHKNIKHNLMILCENCHQLEHHI